MRRLRTPIVVLVALCLVGVSVPAGQTPAPDFSGIDAVIRKELQETQTPGAAVAVVMGDRVIYTRGFGIANAETGEPVRPEMLFRLGSTTKMITAATVVLLAERGRLGLHEPVSKYVPRLDPTLASLTVHQLLSHTSGLFDEAPMFGSHDDEAMKELVGTWRDSRMFFAAPGQIYSYSNPGYWLAGLVAEMVGGSPFADQVASTIFAPLGMTTSTFRPMVAMTYPLAQGHDLVSGKTVIIRPAANNTASWPAGSIFSNVIDLSRWMIAFVNEGLVGGEQRLPASLFRTLAMPHATIPGATATYGYGVRTDTWRGLDIVEHTGSRSGYGSNMRMVPSRKVGVIVLANRTGVTLPRTTDAVLTALLTPAAAPPAPARPPLPTTTSERARYVGTYAQGPRQMQIEVKGEALAVAGSAQAAAMEKVGDHTFVAGATRYVFVTNPAGAVTFLHTGGRSWRKIP